MATKKKDNLKEMKKDELLKQLNLLQEELRVIHFKAEGARSKNVKESTTLKKRIARILTELNRAKGGQAINK